MTDKDKHNKLVRLEPEYDGDSLPIYFLHVKCLNNQEKICMVDEKELRRLHDLIQESGFGR